MADDGILRVSHTRLDMMSRCGEMYRRRYVEGERSRPGVAMVVGRAVDAAVNEDLAAKMDRGELLDVSAIRDVARDTAAREWEEEPPELHDDELEAGEKAAHGAAIDKSVRLAELHHRDIAPGVQPTSVQRGFAVPLTGAGYPVELTGYLDIQEGPKRIRDVKTSGKSPTKDTADNSTQLSIYALAAQALDGVMPAEVVLDYLVDLKTPKAVTLSSVRTPDDVLSVLRRIERFIEAHQRGAFVPARPTDWWCARRWCGYWTTCPFAARPSSVSLATTT